jgi:hypothetical protein
MVVEIVVTEKVLLKIMCKLYQVKILILRYLVTYLVGVVFTLEDIQFSFESVRCLEKIMNL